MRKLIYIIAILLLAIIWLSYDKYYAPETEPDNSKVVKTIEEIDETEIKVDSVPSQEIITVIYNKNNLELKELIHPIKGVRLSPYAYVNVTNDLVFMPADFDFDDSKKYNWGHYDGRGNIIELTIDEYWDKFVFDKDFTQVDNISYDKIIGTGNTVNNVFEIYPQATTIEYHYSGSEKHDSMDWASLRLSFEKYQNEWYLVGVTHDQWTI